MVDEKKFLPEKLNKGEPSSYEFGPPCDECHVRMGSAERRFVTPRGTGHKSCAAHAARAAAIARRAWWTARSVQ